MTTELNHHARQLRMYLEAICSGDCPAYRMPHWRDWIQSGRAGLAVGVSLAVTACGGEFSSNDGNPGPGGSGNDLGGTAGQAAGGRSAVGGIGTLYGMPIGGGPTATGGITARGGAGVIAGAGTLYGIIVTRGGTSGTAGHPAATGGIMGGGISTVYGLPVGS
jgi:hypothetical protein